MFKRFSIPILALVFITLQSCSMTTETTYFKDSATSMKSDILMDTGMLSMLSMAGSVSDMPLKKDNLSTEWKSLYDVQKDGKIVVNDKSGAVLKKMFLKWDKTNGEISGISMKYDKLMPKEVAELFANSKHLKNVPLQNIGNWDGNKLTIDAGKFNVTQYLNVLQEVDPGEENKQPKSKSDSIEAYGRQMAKGMMGMMKMFNMNFKNTLKFQKPIKAIEGKHDFVKQIDNKTILIDVNTKDIWDENKNLKNKDQKIVITTE